MSISPAPHAKLLVAPGCAHCPTVLQHLSTLLKENALGKLEVINIHQHPEIAQQLNHILRPAIILQPDQCIDRIQGIEQEVGIELVAQHL